MASTKTIARRSGTPLSVWDPFRDFDDLFGQLTRWTNTIAWAPQADVSETDERYLIELDLPGVRREDVAIDLDGDVLAITGEITERGREGVFHRRTRRTGRFSYRVTLPRDVDADKVEATMADGVLTVVVPKSESAKPRRIAISTK